jgi:hypothetical protein
LAKWRVVVTRARDPCAGDPVDKGQKRLDHSCIQFAPIQKALTASRT